MAQDEAQVLAASFERVVGDRLVAAERLAAWMPELLGGALVDADVGYSPATRSFNCVS